MPSGQPIVTTPQRVSQLDNILDDVRRDADRARLLEIIAQSSFGRGEVRLASGRVSDFYFDMKPTMLHPEGALLIAKLFCAELASLEVDYVGGLEMGAVPITGAVSLMSALRGTPIPGLFVRKANKEHGARKRLEGLPAGKTIAGKRVAILEDVTTTGESALKAVEVCAAAGAQIAAVISIVDRAEGAADTFAAQGVPFRFIFSATEFLARPA